MRSSLEDRRQWSESHPWWTGCYFSAVTALALGLITGSQLGLRWGVLTGLSIPVWGVPLIAFAIQRQWMQRPNANVAPTPRLGRPWTRTSDRALVWIRAVAIAFVAVTAFDAVAGDGSRSWAAVSLVTFGFVATTAIAEAQSRVR